MSPRKRRRNTFHGMLGTYERCHVHVLCSNLELIRVARTKLAPTLLRSTKPGDRETRKTFYRTMMKHHREAAELFRHYRF